MWGVWGVSAAADRKYMGHGVSEHGERAVYSMEEEWERVSLWCGVYRVAGGSYQGVHMGTGAAGTSCGCAGRHS